MPIISSAVLAASRSSRRGGNGGQSFGGKLEDDMLGVTTFSQQNGSGGNSYQQAASLIHTLEVNKAATNNSFFSSPVNNRTAMETSYVRCREIDDDWVVLDVKTYKQF